MNTVQRKEKIPPRKASILVIKKSSVVRDEKHSPWLQWISGSKRKMTGTQVHRRSTMCERAYTRESTEKGLSPCVLITNREELLIAWRRELPMLLSRVPSTSHCSRVTARWRKCLFIYCAHGSQLVLFYHVGEQTRPGLAACASTSTH